METIHVALELEFSLILCCFLTQFVTTFVPLAKTTQKRLPLLAIGNDWHTVAAALLISNLMQGLR